jgi:hypothetical protein
VILITNKKRVKKHFKQTSPNQCAAALISPAATRVVKRVPSPEQETLAHMSEQKVKPTADEYQDSRLMQDIIR